MSKCNFEPHCPNGFHRNMSMKMKVNVFFSFAEDRMSSLRCSDGSSQHYAQLGLSLKMGAVLKVQLAAQLERGILRPYIQLVSVTPTLDVCVEHRRCPARCFVKRNGVKAGKSEYSSVDEYRYSLFSARVKKSKPYFNAPSTAKFCRC